MERSVSPPEWQVQASTDNHRQRELSVMQEIKPRPLTLLPMAALRGASFSAVLQNAVMRSDFDQARLAERMHISEGYMSRFLKSRAEAWAKRLIKFMRETGDLGPLQWLAEQMGCELVQRSDVERERNELMQKLAELERRAA